MRNKKSGAQLSQNPPPTTTITPLLTDSKQDCLKIRCLVVTVQGWATGCALCVHTHTHTVISPPFIRCQPVVLRFQSEYCTCRDYLCLKRKMGKGIKNVVLGFYWKKRIRHKRSWTYTRWLPLTWRDAWNSISFLPLCEGKIEIKKLDWPPREPAYSVQHNIHANTW